MNCYNTAIEKTPPGIRQPTSDLEPIRVKHNRVELAHIVSRGFFFAVYRQDLGIALYADMKVAYYFRRSPHGPLNRCEILSKTDYFIDF